MRRLASSVGAFHQWADYSAILGQSLATIYEDIVSPPLPGFDCTGHDDEKRVGRDFPKSLKYTIAPRITEPQLAFQKLELVIQLPRLTVSLLGSRLRAILEESKEYPRRLASSWTPRGMPRSLSPASVSEIVVKLRMGAITSRFPLQNLLRKQGLPPEATKPFGSNTEG